MRLAAFSFLAVVPMLVLVWTGAEAGRQRTLSIARGQLLAAARLTAEQQDNVIHEAQNLLHVLVRVPAVTVRSDAACHELLQVVADDHPRIEVLTVVDAGGTAVCNSRDEKPNYNVADRAYFQELMVPSPPDYAVSRLIWGRSANRPVIVVGVPLAQAGPDGKPIGIMIASLNLDWLTRQSRTSTIAGGHSTFIIDSANGSILATDNGMESVGQQSPPELAEAVRVSRGGGIVDVSGVEGAANVFGFAELPAARGRMAIAIGSSREAILSGANEQLRRDLAIGLIAAVVTAGFAYGAAHLWLLRPINRIVVAVREVGRGHRPDRIASDRIPVTELNVLATTINVMVEQIDARDEDLRQMHVALAASEQHHRELAENVTDMISKLAPDFTYLYVSPACRRLLGFEPEELLGRATRGLVHDDDWALLDATLQAPLRSGADESFAAYRAVRKDGAEIWLESSIRRFPDGTGYVVVTRDISERKRFETALEQANAKLEVFARQDALTGLANRRLFDETLRVEWERSRRDRTCLGLILFDVDFFKSYNDTLGHQAGDECLRLVGKALAGMQRRPGDVMARYGGEEFGLILPNADLVGVADVGERVVRAIRALKLPHPKNPTSIVTVSGGGASMNGLRPETCSPEMLIQAADVALYEAKRSGRNRLRVDDAAPPASSSIALLPASSTLT